MTRRLHRIATTMRIRRPESDGGAVSTGAILVSEGSVTARARPAESISRVLDALGENPRGTRKSLCRLYFHRQFRSPYGNCLRSWVSPIIDLPCIRLFRFFNYCTWFAVLKAVSGCRKWCTFCKSLASSFRNAFSILSTDVFAAVKIRDRCT